MSALLTYRSRNSFEARFGRNIPDPSRQQNINGIDHRPPTPAVNEHWAVHNEGHKRAKLSSRTSEEDVAKDMPDSPGQRLAPAPASAQVVDPQGTAFVDPQFSSLRQMPSSTPPVTPLSERKRATTYFSAQSYLRYQGEKFVKRFDSNCYIAITRKLDTHDVSRQRVDFHSSSPVAEALAMIEQPALIIGIESDGLFTFAEQQEIAAGIPNARLRTIDSPEGHDAFLLQFEQVNRHILEFLNEVLPDIMNHSQLAEVKNEQIASAFAGANALVDVDSTEVEPAKEVSVFGEEELGSGVDDITAW